LLSPAFFIDELTPPTGFEENHFKKNAGIPLMKEPGAGAVEKTRLLVATSSGIVGVGGKFFHELEKRWRLPDEKAHVG
jgi:hypothetical protein